MCFRFILTADNKTSGRFSRLEGSASERVLRDAIEKTFRGATRGTQTTMFRLASRALPRALRQAIEVLRRLRRLDGRYR